MTDHRCIFIITGINTLFRGSIINKYGKTSINAVKYFFVLLDGVNRIFLKKGIKKAGEERFELP